MSQRGNAAGHRAMKRCSCCSKHQVSHRTSYSDSALYIAKERISTWTINARPFPRRSPNATSSSGRTNERPGFGKPQYPGDQSRAVLNAQTSDPSFSRNCPVCSDTNVGIHSGRVLARRLWQISCRRDKILEVRSQLAFEQQNLEYASGFEHESIQQLMEFLQDAVRNGKLETRCTELSALYDQCQDDRASRRAKELQISSLRADLAILEYRLMEKERELALYLGNNLNAIALSEDASTDPTSPSTDVPSLLEKYYDRKGDIGIQIERLQELKDRHREEKIHRDFMADRDEPTNDTDEEFRLRYEEQRQHILDTLAAARWDVHELQVACEGAGLLIKPESTDAFANLEAHTLDSRGVLDASRSPSIPHPGTDCGIGHLSPSIKMRRTRDLFDSMPQQSSPDLSRGVVQWLEDVCTASPSRSSPSMWQHLDMEALDLASGNIQTPEIRPGSNSNKRWHCRCSSN